MRLLSAGFIVCVLLMSCKKSNPDPSIDGDPGSVTATINGKEWRSKFHSAIYYKNWHQLSIEASDHLTYHYYCGINLDSAHVLRNYLLENHGDNASAVTDFSNFGIPDKTSCNLMEAGGFFNLTKLDTVNKVISGTTSFVAFSRDRTHKLELTSGVITDIPLTIESSAFDGNYAECTVSGVKTATWHSKDISTTGGCTVTENNVTARVLRISLSDLLGSRQLLITLPLSKATGNYPIYAYSGCNADVITAEYTCSEVYNVLSGTLNLLSHDTAAKTLHAKFNLSVKGGTFPETIQISNGEMFIRYN